MSYGVTPQEYINNVTAIVGAQVPADYVPIYAPNGSLFARTWGYWAAGAAVLGVLYWVNRK